MISASAAFKAAVRQNPNTKFKATLRFANGSTLALTDQHLMEESQAYTEGVSSDGSFDVGAAIIGKFAFSLDNSAGTYDSRAFEGATVTPYVGKEVDGSTVWIQKGIYGIEQPNTYGTVIRLSALDNMRKFERTYADVSTTYPATLDTILRAICTKCGVTLATSNFPNKSYVVSTRPDGDLTCLQMVAYIAQLAGCWARCDPQGRLELGWYDKSFFDGTPAAGTYANLDMLSNMSVYTDDVVVTGVRMKAMDQVASDGTKGADGESYLYGAEGYVLDLSGNPLCLYGKAQACATFIGQRTVGLRFRPFNATAVGDPTIQAGDPAIVTDAAGRKYNSYVTSLTYKGTGFEQFSCGAEYPGRNKAQSFSEITNAIILANKAVEKEKTARELAVENLQRQIVDNASGLFMTTKVQPDGSTIYYMHDQKTLAESQIVWKLTRDAFGISTDGGRTYPYGIDVNGDAILNRIYAIGIDADYIDTGRIEVKKDGEAVFLADYDTGSVLIQDRNGNMWNTSTGQIRMLTTTQVGDTTMGEIIADAEAAVNVAGDVSKLKAGTSKGVDVQYGLSSSENSKPTSWQTDARKLWNQKGKFLWTRQKITMYDGKVTYSEPRLLSDGKQLVKDIREQYYLSTSKTAPSGGSWAEKPQAYIDGRYYWTRNRIEWADGTVTYEPSANGELAQSFTTVVGVYDDKLDHVKVFNKLTKYGTAKGLATDSRGNLYFNADYISTGILRDKRGLNYWNLNTGDLQFAAVAALEEQVENINVGGTNLLNGTREWVGWTKRGRFAFSGDQANSPGQSADWGDSVYSPLASVQYGQVQGKEVTVSFDMKCSSAWGAVADRNSVNVCFELHTASSRARTRWRNFRVSKAPTTSWQRVSITTVVNNALFTGGTASISTANLLGLEIYNRSSKALQIRRVKLEVGNVATDWSATDYDAQQDATAKANKALADGKTYAAAEVKKAKTETRDYAKTYADSISSKDRQYTDKQKKDLDDSLNAEKVFNKLSRNGSIPGLFPSKNAQGKVTGYYFNASYINTGTLDAKVIKAGIIAPKANGQGDFKINMATGYVSTRNMEATNIKANGGSMTVNSGSTKLVLQDGQLRGYRGNSRVGFIDATARVNIIGGRTGKVLKTVDGLQLQSTGILRISAPRIGVMNTSNTSTTTVGGFTGYVHLKNITFGMNRGMSSCYVDGEVQLRFINGIFVGVTRSSKGLVSATKQEGEDD